MNDAPEYLLMVKAVADKLDARECGDPDAPSLIVYRRAERAEAELYQLRGTDRWYSAEMMDAVVKDRDALKAVLRELVEAAKHYRNYAELGLPNTDLFAASDAAIARAEEVLG